MARELWYADGYLLSNREVRDVSYDSTIFDTPGKRGDNSVIAQNHGEIWRPKFYTANSFTLNMWTFNRVSQATAIDLYRELIRVVNRTNELVTYERKWDDNSRAYRCQGEVITAVSPAFTSNRSYRFGIEVVVPGAFWEASGASTHSTPASATLPQTLTLTNHADSTAPMSDFTYTIVGPVTNPRVETMKSGAVTGVYVQYNGTVGAGQSLVINANTWAVTGTGGLTVNESLLDYNSGRYLTIQARMYTETAPQLRFTGSNAAATTQLSVTGRSKVLV